MLCRLSNPGWFSDLAGLNEDVLPRSATEMAWGHGCRAMKRETEAGELARGIQQEPQASIVRRPRIRPMNQARKPLRIHDSYETTKAVLKLLTITFVCLATGSAPIFLQRFGGVLTF